MKSRRYLILLVLLLLSLSGCGGDGGKTGTPVDPTEDQKAEAGASLASETEKPSPTLDRPSADTTVLEIGEKMFLTQINDIYYNFDDYKDKTIIVEGMYALFYSWDEDQKVPVVYRNGPGCCGNDGWGGFLLKYDGQFPNENDWICVTGTPELETTESGYMNLNLNVTSIEVKTERGAEFVAQ